MKGVGLDPRHGRGWRNAVAGWWRGILAWSWQQDRYEILKVCEIGRWIGRSVRDGRFGLLYCTASGVLCMFNGTCGCALITALISLVAGVFLLKSGNFKI